jgi:hypothetical protein
VLDERAPFWRGETAEKLVRSRQRETIRAKEAKAEERAAKRAARPKRERRTIDGVPSMRAKTPQQQLKRLERALARRKTVAGREAVAARIRALTAALEAASE